MKPERETRRESNSRVSRRAVLKGVGAATLATVGAASMTSPVASQVSEDDVIIIDIEDGWWSGYEADDDLPVVDSLFTFTHGWYGNSDVEGQVADVAGSANDAGYTADAYVGFRWPSDTLDYGGAEEDTEDVGAEQARLIDDFKNSGGGDVMVTGHSLGGRCAYWTAVYMSDHTIETVGALGTAAQEDEVCPGYFSDGDFYPGLPNADTVRNYHSYNDDTVGDAYNDGLGNEGAECDPADNYTDVDVTDTVADHFQYLGDAQVGSDLAASHDA